MRFFAAPTLLLAALAASGAVVNVDISERADLPIQGYERLSGKIHFAVDPKLAANQIVADISLAPLNGKGLVEFSSDLLVMRPKDPSKGNGTALVDIPNRGTRTMLNLFNLENGRDFKRAEDFGDPLLFEQGFTLVWIGWEWDLPQRDNLLKLYAPSIKGLTGVVRSEIMLDKKATVQSLGDRAQIPYYVADTKPATLTVRDQVNGPRTLIPNSEWHFTPDGGSVEYPAGFEPGRIYEVVYQGKDPALAGLGMAATRDYVSYLKQKGEARRAIGFGQSQSGRFLRTFLYYGFNADEQGKRVFDGVWAGVPGAGRGAFDHRFAQPSRDGGPRTNLFYETDLFPFTDNPETDGTWTDGLLLKAQKAGVVPKIFYSNGSYEYWGRNAALLHVSPDGKHDVEPAKDTRIYYIAGAQHNANTPPARQATQNLTNPLDYRLAFRALLLDLNAWVTNGAIPPPSRYPRLDKDTLVAPSALAFPHIPGAALPIEPAHAYRLDFGPDFRSKGIVTIDPPKVGAMFPALVPQVDSDGNETAGVRLPDQQVPLATYTGWNPRSPSVGGADSNYTFMGSMIPFPRTKADRDKSGDPRPSIEERYQSLDAYLKQVESAARALVAERFMLERDVPLAVEKARTRWNSLQ